MLLSPCHTAPLDGDDLEPVVRCSVCHLPFSPGAPELRLAELTGLVFDHPEPTVAEVVPFRTPVAPDLEGV